MTTRTDRSKIPETRILRDLLFELIADNRRLQKIENDIARSKSKTQLGYLIDERDRLLKQVRELRAMIAERLTLRRNIDFRLFHAICRILDASYGRGVSESVILTFEREAGLQAPEIVNYPEIFDKVIGKIFGKRAANNVRSLLKREIAGEFGLQFSNKTMLSEAIRIVTQKPRPIDN